jgi:4-hydroxy-3-methylbut-2-enyl diphosphate reductase
VEEAAGKGFKVYTLGPLIHNPQVLENFASRGVDVLAEGGFPADLKNSVVIIRAHGAPPGTGEELRRRGAAIIDATCPHVKASQKKARSLAEKGYRIFLAGDGRHGEIAGIRGFAEAGAAGGKDPGCACIVVGNPEEAEKAAAKLFGSSGSGARTALIGQTTITPEEYAAIGEKIKKYFPDLTVIDSICGATRNRQEALRELCSRVDCVVIAGGRQSANTRRLLDIARGMGKKAWLVESAAEIPPELAVEPSPSWSVGLAAGASTPDEVIDAIEKALRIGYISPI